MSSLTERHQDALRFITGFELRYGRGPSVTEVAEGQFGGALGFTEGVIHALVVAGKLRRLPRSRLRKLQVLQPVAVPRAPDGEPLHFIPVARMFNSGARRLIGGGS
ncbi:MAG: hypothetical protein U0975_09780 [Erythrobacter sp.]|nr:hypothetical protein [Erythrobacter sp.]MDZ4138719.1 hypothetical protein [Erythrobacter sp.]MDZ4272950.1 hypothetical protein [Erythrobacter sp.]